MPDKINPVVRTPKGNLTVILPDAAMAAGIAYGTYRASLLALVYDEVGVEFTDNDSVWLYKDDEGRGFETVQEAFDFLLSQDEWSGWRKRTDEEENE